MAWSDRFHDLFAAAAANAQRAAANVEERFRDYPDTVVSQQDIKDLEHEGDRITTQVHQLLNTEFDTPFGRDDIYMLASSLDDVVDHIEHASDLLGLYRIEAPMAQSLEQCRVLVQATEALSRAIQALHQGRAVEPHLAAVSTLEDEGDQVSRLAVASLFEHEDINPRVIIQWKDIFEVLEQAVDSCERAAHLVGNIVVKSR